MISPLYKAGEMLMRINRHMDGIPIAYIVVDAFWTGGDYTYQLYSPTLDKDVYKTEVVLNTSYEVVA